jgi:hypothetical protein
MKRNVYFLIFLSIWAQIDDILLTPASAYQSAPFPGDDDEYLPLKRQDHQQEFAPGRQPQSESVRFQTADLSFVEKNAPSDWNLTTPFAPASLYVFMSLQI